MEKSSLDLNILLYLAASLSTHKTNRKYFNDILSISSILLKPQLCSHDINLIPLSYEKSSKVDLQHHKLSTTSS